MRRPAIDDRTLRFLAQLDLSVYGASDRQAVQSFVKDEFKRLSSARFEQPARLLGQHVGQMICIQELAVEDRTAMSAEGRDRALALIARLNFQYHSIVDQREALQILHELRKPLKPEPVAPVVVKVLPGQCPSPPNPAGLPAFEGWTKHPVPPYWYKTTTAEALRQRAVAGTNPFEGWTKHKGQPNSYYQLKTEAELLWEQARVAVPLPTLPVHVSIDTNRVSVDMRATGKSGEMVLLQIPPLKVKYYATMLEGSDDHGDGTIIQIIVGNRLNGNIDIPMKKFTENPCIFLVVNLDEAVTLRIRFVHDCSWSARLIGDVR